jgi:hypothetical protein
VFLWAATQLRDAARHRLAREVGGLREPSLAPPSGADMAEPAAAEKFDTSRPPELA